MSPRSPSGDPPQPPSKPSSPDSLASEAEVTARVTEMMDLVPIIARQLTRELYLSVELDELLGYGREGLFSAARSFDAGRGVPFRRWANIRVRGAMIDGVRSMGHLPRRAYRQVRAMEAAARESLGLSEQAGPTAPATPEEADERLSVYLTGIATAMAVGFVSLGTDGNDAPDESESAETHLARQELLGHVKRSIAELPDIERKLLERHYFHDVTFDEAARELGLSKSWASRLHARAIERIARDLKRARVHS